MVFGETVLTRIALTWRSFCLLPCSRLLAMQPRLAYKRNRLFNHDNDADGRTDGSCFSYDRLNRRAPEGVPNLQEEPKIGEIDNSSPLTISMPSNEMADRVNATRRGLILSQSLDHRQQSHSN
jgi:hypothetical protein